MRFIHRPPAVLAAIGIATAWFVLPSRADFETPVAITNVTIVARPGETIEGGTIVIEDGRFTAVGKDVPIPAHAERIDGTGLIAYPGFIDAFCHLGIADTKRTEAERQLTEDENPDPREAAMPATRGADRRGIRPQLRALDLYKPDDKALDAHRSAGFAAALVAPRYGILAGRSDLISLSGDPIRRCVVAPDVAMHASFDPGEPGEYPSSLMGAIALFRQVMLDAGWYTRVQKYNQRHPDKSDRAPHDPALEAVQPLLAREQRVFFAADDENEILRALNLAEEFKLSVVIRGGREAYKVADRLAKTKTAVIVSLKFDEEPQIQPQKKGKKKPKPDTEKEPAEAPEPEKPDEVKDDPSSEEKEKKEEKEGEDEEKDDDKLYEPLKVRKERHRLWKEKIDNVIRLHEAGVPFALSSADVKDAAELLKNLRKLIDHGLPEEAAVRALTVSAAEILGAADQLGAIDPGHLASAVLMSGTLSDAKSFPRFVFVEGRKFELNRDKKPPKPTDKKKAEEEKEKKKEEEPTDTGPAFASEIREDRLPKTRTGGDVFIRGGTIMPITGPAIDNASILIIDGRIKAIGGSAEAPAGVTVIDATGKFIMPGIVDCHSHLGVDGGVNEGTLAVTAEVRIADILNPHSVGLYRALAGGATTHHVMHGSANPIGGQNATVKLKYERPTGELPIPGAPRTVKFALGENVKQSNFAGAEGKRFPNSRMGVESAIRDALETAVRYSTDWEDYLRRHREGEDLPPPRFDLRLAALSDVLSGELMVHSHCYRSDEILRLMNVAEDYGFRIMTLQHVLEGYRIAPEIARHGAGASTFANFWAYKVESYGAIAHNAALMTQHGINTSINSDSPLTIRYLVQEAAKCIRFGGLNENEALRLVTINPAMQLGIEDRVGSLEVGKDGDVSIWNGHPLNSFSKCAMTLIEGEVYFEDDAPATIEDASTVNIVATVDRAIPQTRHSAYAIVGATIHPMTSPDADVIENGTVVIVDNAIQAVGAGAIVPPGAGVIDGKGLHVYPGLIDADTTIGLSEIGSLRATRDNADIGTYHPHLRAASAVHPHSEHVRIARTCGTTTALAAPSGGRISGVGGVIHLDGWTADEMFVADGGLHMSVPSLPANLPEKDRTTRKKEHDKTMHEFDDYMARARHYAEVHQTRAAEPRGTGVPARREGEAREGEAPAEPRDGSAPADPRLDVDLDLEAMIPFVLGERPVFCEANGYKQILDTLDFAEKHKLRPVIVGGQEAWKLADKLAEKRIPVIISTTLGYPSSDFEPWDSVYHNAAVLDAAGVPIAFGSNGAADGYNLGVMTGLAVAHGLPRRRAEYALTRGAAEILGLGDRLGSIEEGQRADLIVTTDSPLQTVSLVTHMFIDGRPIDLTSLHTESYEKFKNRPEPELPAAPVLRGWKSLSEPRP